MTDTKVILLTPGSPNLNAHLERYLRSLKSGCLNRLIFFGRRSLERALQQFVAHYHRERNHQGLDKRIIDPGEEIGKRIGDDRCRERPGGMLRYYHREAAQDIPSWTFHCPILQDLCALESRHIPPARCSGLPIPQNRISSGPDSLGLLSYRC